MGQKFPKSQMMIVRSEPLSFLGMTAIVASEPMRQLLLTVERVALSNASVLIEGESGSGKELIARALHQYSMRASKPWVDVSCAALPEHLIESELFGYEKGAFSGADSAKPGLFELAHTGTIFLDEVGELEPKMQVKLLRVLDGTPYYRLGGVRKISVDVRVIAATNQNLQNLVSQGRFRGDLYHRLSQIDLTVPPLRDRVDDVIPLAEHFLAAQNQRLRFTGDACEKLRGYRWPGNIRELRNVVTKAAVLARDNEIRGHQLPIEVQPAARFRAASDDADLGAVERHMIFKVLEQTGGHHQRAADLLGISRRTLTRKLKSYSAETGAEQYVG
jgi:transcriptional regulator with PAS, ATPase and Fis domain